MAKSLRSKRKRKTRAVKRERYGKKELDRLKTMLGINTTDVEMKEEKLDDDIVVVTTAEEIRSRNEGKEKEDTKEVDSDDKAVVLEAECEPMDDGRRVFNKKTFKDQHGNYPVWLGSRKLKKTVKRNQSSKRKQKKNKSKNCKTK